MASVKKEEIPIMHKFMPEFWKTIKEFYGIEDNDEYWHALTERANELREVYPDSLVDYLTMAFVKWADDMKVSRQGKIYICTS